MSILTLAQNAKVRQLMEDLHSLAALMDRIEDANQNTATTRELSKLANELDKGLDTACNLAKALNHTALCIRLELLALRSK